MSKRGIFTRGEWEPVGDEDCLKIVVIRDSKSKALFAHGIPSKGIDQDRYVIDKVVDDIGWLGHTRLLLKSDNEPAIAKLIRESLKALRIDGKVDQAGEEHSVPYDPQTNGSAELGG